MGIIDELADKQWKQNLRNIFASRNPLSEKNSKRIEILVERLASLPDAAWNVNSRIVYLTKTEGGGNYINRYQYTVSYSCTLNRAKFEVCKVFRWGEGDFSIIDHEYDIRLADNSGLPMGSIPASSVPALYWRLEKRISEGHPVIFLMARDTLKYLDDRDSC